MTVVDDVMLRNVFGKTLWDQRRSLLGWTIALFGITIMMASFWPTMEAQAEQMQQLIESYPPAFQAFFNIDDFTTPEGYLQAELFSATMPILFLVYAIARGANLIAGEEERGSLDVLVAHPLPRRAILLQKAGALTVGTLGLGLVLFLSLLVGNAAWSMGVSPLNLAAGSFLLSLFALGFGMLALALGAWRGRKTLALGATAAVAVAAFLLNSFANLVEWLERARWLSPFAHLVEPDPLANGFDPLSTLVLLLIPAALLAVAALGFERRDVGV